MVLIIDFSTSRLQAVNIYRLSSVIMLERSHDITLIRVEKPICMLYKSVDSFMFKQPIRYQWNYFVPCLMQISFEMNKVKKKKNTHTHTTFVGLMLVRLNLNCFRTFLGGGSENPINSLIVCTFAT